MTNAQRVFGGALCIATVSFVLPAQADRGKYTLRTTAGTVKGKKGMWVKGHVTVGDLPSGRLSIGKAGHGLPVSSNEKRKAGRTGSYLLKILGSWSGKKPNEVVPISEFVSYNGKTLAKGKTFDLVGAFWKGQTGFWGRDAPHIYGMKNGPIQSGRVFKMP